MCFAGSSSTHTELKALFYKRFTVFCFTIMFPKGILWLNLQFETKVLSSERAIKVAKQAKYKKIVNLGVIGLLV